MQKIIEAYAYTLSKISKQKYTPDEIIKKLKCEYLGNGYYECTICEKHGPVVEINTDIIPILKMYLDIKEHHLKQIINEIITNWTILKTTIPETSENIEEISEGVKKKIRIKKPTILTKLIKR